MFELPIPFGKRLRELRERLSLSQTDLARCIGVPRNLIGDYESGRRRPDRLRRDALTGVFHESVSLGTDWECGEPAWKTAQNALLRPFRVSPAPIPPPELPASAHYAAAMQAFPGRAPALVAAIYKRPDLAEVSLHLASLRFRSGSEAMLALWVAAANGRPIACRLPALGLTRHPMVHVLSNLPTGHIEWPGFQIQRGSLQFCLFSDVGVRTPWKGYTMDFWCRVREPRHDWQVDVEVDGAGHCGESDEIRRQRLGYLELRLNDGDLAAEDFWKRFDGKLAAVIAPKVQR